MTMKALKLFLKSLPLWVIVLAITELVLSNELAAQGEYTSQLSAKIEELNSQNELLSQQVAYESSLTTIAQKAQAMELVEPTAQLTLSPLDFSVALAPRQ